jgi:predicted amidohydrolase
MLKKDTPPKQHDLVEKVLLSIVTVQVKSCLGDPNLTYTSKVKEYLKQFEKKPIDVIVLPELALTGYDFRENYQQVFNIAELSGQVSKVPGGPLTNFEIAKAIAVEYGAYVVLGYPEKELMTESMLAEYEAETSFDGQFGAEGAAAKKKLDETLIAAGEKIDSDEIEAPEKPRLFSHENAPQKFRLFNSCYVLDRNGNIVMNYRKILLFGTDKRYFHPGSPDQNRSFHLETKLGKTVKCAVAICMDINYKNFTEF